MGKITQGEQCLYPVNSDLAMPAFSEADLRAYVEAVQDSYVFVTERGLGRSETGELPTIARLVRSTETVDPSLMNRLGYRVGPRVEWHPRTNEYSQLGGIAILRPLSAEELKAA